MKSQKRSKKLLCLGMAALLTFSANVGNDSAGGRDGASGRSGGRGDSVKYGGCDDRGWLDV